MSRCRIFIPLATLSALLLATSFAARPAMAQDSNSVAAQQEVRIQQLEGQMRDMNGQIEQLNYRVQQLSDRLDKLVADVDFRLREIEGGGGSTTQGQAQGQPPPGPPPSQPSGQEPMTPLASEPPPANGAGMAPPSSAQPKSLGSLTQSQYDAQAKQLNQNADPAAAAKAAGALQTQQSTGGQTANLPPQDYTLPGSTPDEQYQYAFDLLRQTKYDEAEKALHTFVDEYPENPLAGNASYWLGETYFVRQDYNNAALTFAQGFQKYPKSGKAPDTLLKLGMSLAALGETADACKALHELSTRFPAASDTIKQRAAKERSKNGCH